ncbi:MAG: hypothetical protein ACI8VC_002587 [Candidatus Endobugula sp.]|jgi:hypothetical protein
MNSDDLKKEINERIKNLVPEGDELPKLHDIQKKEEKIDLLRQRYFKALEEERRNSQKEYYDFRKHGFMKVFHRSLISGSPKLSPAIIIIILLIFILAIAYGFVNA